MSAEQKPPIVIKRIKRSGGGHHGGSWKIAYADFVTAMMAFFLLMWLLGSTTQGELQGIAEYFKTPLKVALAGGSGSGDSSSVIKGGGTDLTRSVGQQQKTDKPDEKRTINLKAAEAELERQESGRLLELKSKLDAAIDANALLRPYKNQLRVDITPDGLRVQIVDEQNRPMFDSGSATLKDYTREILRELGKLMNDVPNRISLSGHTDANPYALGERGYSNWELSADRANASRRELIIGGIAEKKIIRIVGLGAAVMLDKADPYNPINRRISIIVLNHKAEERILEDSVMQEAVPPPRAAAAAAPVAATESQPPDATAEPHPPAGTAPSPAH
jgi:chemotaxis protein MotB